MSVLHDWEKLGLTDFFQMNENSDIMEALARAISKNMLNVATKTDALNIILLHSESSTILLNKRLITKNILYKYLNSKNISLTNEIKKVNLIDKIQHYWKDNFIPKPISSTNTVNESIEMLCIKFSEWFFNGWNQDSLRSFDLWSNSNLDLQIFESNGCPIELYDATTSVAVINTIIEVRRKYKYYLNANTTNQGTSQRIDCHGLVLVLCCGTVHIQNLCVGIFESTFGLIKDPNEENNWKIKSIKLIFKISENTPLMLNSNS